MEADVEPRLPRILVGIPCGFTVDSFFAQTFSGALVGHGQLFWAEQAWAIGHITDDARNEICKTAAEQDYDFVFFMDSDMIHPKATLAKLLRDAATIAGDDPIVIGGIYNTRSDHRVNCYTWNEEQQAFEPVGFELYQGVHAVDFVATGCMLIDVGLFDRLDWPWFYYDYRPSFTDNKRRRWSEDAVFAKKCLDAGIPHYVDTGVVCGHVHSVVIEQVSKTDYQVKKMGGEKYADYSRETVQV